MTKMGGARFGPGWKATAPAPLPSNEGHAQSSTLDSTQASPLRRTVPGQSLAERRQLVQVQLIDILHNVIAQQEVKQGQLLVALVAGVGARRGLPRTLLANDLGASAGNSSQ